MSDLFRNIVFVLCIASCLIVTGFNHYVAIENSEVVKETFHSLAVQQAESNQIEDAQNYGMRMGQIAFFQATHVIKLEQQLVKKDELIASLEQRLDQTESQFQLYDLSLEAQGSYIQQLSAFIKSKGLETPVPIATAEPSPAYHEFLLDKNGHPTQ